MLHRDQNMWENTILAIFRILEHCVLVISQHHELTRALRSTDGKTKENDFQLFGVLKRPFWMPKGLFRNPNHS